jgi:hypothetical protein
MRIALFITCFNDTFFPQVGIATTRLLERLGQEAFFCGGRNIHLPSKRGIAGSNSSVATMWSTLGSGFCPNAMHSRGRFFRYPTIERVTPKRA